MQSLQQSHLLWSYFHILSLDHLLELFWIEFRASEFGQGCVGGEARLLSRNLGKDGSPKRVTGVRLQPPQIREGLNERIAGTH